MDWRSSSYCESSACVEVARGEDYILVRHSEGSPTISFTEKEWHTFVEGVKSGEFDL